jgi:hypothetical protein
LLFEAINGFQRTAAIKAAIEVGLFTAIGEGHATPQGIAWACKVSRRGARILSDTMVALGFLTKEGQTYALTPDTAAFLDRHSPTYMGGMIDFLASPTLTDAFRNLTTAVRTGTTGLGTDGTMAPDHPVWVQFARAMMPMMAMPAEQMARIVACDPDRPLKVLDVAAGHGLFGIAFARRYPRLEVTALDWPKVLDVAAENAMSAGMADRFRLLPGSAFDVEWGSGYDLVLFTNFLHHFDPPTCETLARKAHAALGEGGRAVTLEFVPNEDRVSPPASALFSLVMLATTGSGDAYTFGQLDQYFRNAGFARSEIQPLPPSPEHLVISYR